MTVEELMKILEKFPKKMEVITSGYEYGYENLEEKQIYKLKILKNVHNEFWAGPHESPTKHWAHLKKDHPDKKVETVLHIGRWIKDD